MAVLSSPYDSVLSSLMDLNAVRIRIGSNADSCGSGPDPDPDQSLKSQKLNVYMKYIYKLGNR